MPENKLPPPSQILGTTSKLPPPNAVLNQSIKSSGTDYSFLGDIQDTSKADEIINKLDASSDEKQVIKNLAIAEKQGKATKEDLSNAILTVQSQHPLQDGGQKYYMKDGKPIPIRNDERPPQGYDVASIWGSQESANNDNVLTSAAKHLVNGVIGAAEGVANLPQIPYGALTGEELPWYQTMKNAGDYLKFKTPDYEKTGKIFDTKNLTGVKDFFDPSRYDFNKNNIQGAMLQGLESITSFLVGAKGVGTAAKSLGAVSEGAGLITEGGKLAEGLAGATNTGKLATSFAGSYMVNYDEALNAAEQAGLTGQNKYAFASIATIPTAILEMVGGTEGLFVRNQLARTGKKEMLKSLAVGLEEETTGKLTKESLEGLYNATTTAATKLNSTFAGQVGANITGEAGTEAAQALALNSAKNIYDKVSGEEKFKSDPFSLESWGEYVNNALAGGLGAGGPALVGVSQKRKIDKEELQANNAYEVVKKGNEAITALKADIDNSVKTGDLTPIQAEHAKFKVDVYNEYYQQTKDSKLDDDEKKKAFNLAYSISGVKSEIPTDESDIKKLSPIELAKVNAKKELVKGLQKELDAIILKENVTKETNVGSDTINKVEKHEEKKVEQTPLSELQKRYGGSKEDIVTEKEIPTTESNATDEVKGFVDNIKKGVSQNSLEQLQFYQNNKEAIENELQARKSERRKNSPKFDQKNANGTYEFNKQKPLEKKEILHDYFDEHPELNNEMEAKIEGGQNNVWSLNLGNDRYVKFAKSVVPDKYTGENKNFPGKRRDIGDSAGNPHYIYDEPVIVKFQRIIGDKEGRKGKSLGVLNIFNKETGKYISSVKEREKGNSDYTEGEIKQFVELQKAGIEPQIKEKVTEQPKEIKAAVKESKIISEPIKERPATTKVEAKEIKSIKVEVSKNDRNILLDEGYTDKDIDKSESEANRLVNMPTTEIVDELHKKGFFNSVGKTEEWRPNLGLKTAEVTATLKQLKSGKETATTKVLNNFINRIKETGVVEMIGQTGGMTEKFNMPLHQFLLGEKSQRELTDEEVKQELEKESARNEAFAETGQFQKASERKGQIEKVVERIKKSFPKVKVIYNPDLKYAGRLKGNTIEINPDYAGIDTPIHEAGHVLIDAIGYDNKVIQQGIQELKGTPFWENTKKNYPKLNEEMLGKEVLAEAIGMEGSLIFDSESARNKFAAILSYIFVKLKQLLGIDKNVAKSLAKQIIGGVKTKGLTGESNESQHAKKKTFKTLEEMSAKDLSRKLTMSLEAYRENVLGRSLEQIRKDIQFIDDALTDDKYSAEEKKEFKAILENIKKEEKRDSAKWFAYKEDVEMLSSIMSEGRLEDMTDDKLIEAYNLMTANFQDAAKEAKLNQLKTQIAYRMFQERKGELKQYDKFVEEIANKKDLSVKDVMMKNLGHMTENQPELQKFSKMFDDTHFNMQSERYDLKTQLETIGKEVIKEKNKSIGITDKAKEFAMSGSIKYFDFVEHPDGRYYTLEESKNFTPAQTKFLKFMLNLNELRNQQLADMDIDEVNNEVLKVDKGVKEAFRDEGILQAFSSFLGNGHNLQNVRINYEGKPASYGEIEKDLINKGNKGTVDNLKALLKMANYQLKARRQLKTGTNIDKKENPLALMGGSEYNLSTDGRLKSKFNKPRDKSRGYSKDFYKAAHSFIDDYTHVKHMQPLLPYIQSIEHLNKVGFGEHGKKESVAEWVKQWTDLHIFKKEKVGALGPELDTFFKLMRKLTSLSVMAFNIPAGGWNLAMGIYNNIRSESAEIEAKGLKRLFGGTNRGGYGAYNKKAAEILKKYQVVSFDLDSNPKIGASKIFETLAHGVTRAGEYTIQGSLFLGLMSQEEYDSFEFKEVNGVKELLLKDGVDAKNIKDKFIGYKNRISDIQGKYASHDMRNFQAGEFGKAAIQFRLWSLDWFRERFGERYIDSNGNAKMGSWRQFVGEGLDELRADIKEKGVVKAIWDNKNAMANLKGAMTVAVFLSLGLGEDDDKKKRKAGDMLSKATGNLLFIFDSQTLKFTVEHPIASMSVLTRFVDALDHAMKFDMDKAGHDIGNALPYNKGVKQIAELTEED